MKETTDKEAAKTTPSDVRPATPVNRLWKQEQLDQRKHKASAKARRVLQEAYDAGVPWSVIEEITQQIWSEPTW